MTRAEAQGVAEDWARFGIPAFPIGLKWNAKHNKVEKRPLNNHGHLNATVDLAEIARLFKAVKLGPGEHYGTGLYLGPADIVALDIDTKGDVDGEATLDQLIAELGQLPKAVRVRTASDGFHIWLKRPKGLDHIGNSPFGPGIDIRCDAGWVVAPKTFSPWGSWTKDAASALFSEFEQLPAAWAKRLTEGNRRPIAAAGEPVPTGRRDTFLISEAGAMRNRGWSEQSILNGLDIINNERCEPPKPEKDLRRIAKSAMRWEPEGPGLAGIILPGAEPEDSATLEPVDLRALMSGEPPEKEWLVEPILPAGKLVGVVSKRGEGKSLLVLDVAAAKAAGLSTLSHPASDPIDVVYLDMEMGPEDLYERLADLGYLPEHPSFDILASHLHYYQLVNLPPLNTEAGGRALEGLVERHGARLVVIDTVSRVVTGDENLCGALPEPIQVHRDKAQASRGHPRPSRPSREGR